MIVKNEAHIICETLEKLLKKIKIDYWVICDTGSNDGTQQLITNFFANKNIKGKLYENEWKDFGHNRTLALNYAFGKSDYLLIFDADDEIVGDFVLPEKMESDAYKFIFKSNSQKYERILLVNNNIKFRFVGVLHELIEFVEFKYGRQVVTLSGDYHVDSGRLGNRNKNPNKYLDDAKLLEKSFLEIESDENYKNDRNKVMLLHRYAFYCANSYRDFGDFENSLRWYKKTVEISENPQEKYIAVINIYDAYKRIGTIENSIQYLLMGLEYDDSRPECIYYLMLYYSSKQMFRLAFSLYSIAENTLSKSVENKILYNENIMLYDLPNLLIYIAGNIGREDIVIAMYDFIFKRKYPNFTETQFRNMIANYHLFIDLYNTENQQKLQLFDNYIEFVKTKFDVTQYGEFIDKIRFYLKIDPTYKIFNNNKKNIFLYSGSSPFEWNLTYAKTNAIGGSEYCLASLVEAFSKYYNVFVSGDVKSEIVGNICFVNSNDTNGVITKDFVFKTCDFEFAITSRQLNFFSECKKIKTYHVYVWAHDCMLSPLSDTNSILKKLDNQIDKCVCLTQWHKDLFELNYPSLRNKIEVIGNGLDLTKFENIDNKNKIKNRFIYTSDSVRGLLTLVSNWGKILSICPDAELVISSYNSFPRENIPSDMEIYEIIKNYNSIKHLGKLNKQELYNLMASSEYWLYPTNFPETFCITATEMLKSRVICIYYPLAGLVNTVGDYGFPIGNLDDEYEMMKIKKIMNMTEEEKNVIRNKGEKYASSISWESKAESWISMHYNYRNYLPYELPKYNLSKIKIVNLERRPDRKMQMIEKLAKQNFTENEYEFIKARDGQKLDLTDKLIKLFKDNNHDYKKSVIGVALSNLDIYYNLLINCLDYVVILEDDIEFCDDFKNKLNRCVELALQNEYYDVVCFGENASKRIINKNVDNLKIDEIVGSHMFIYGYVVKRSAAEKCVDYIEKQSIRAAFDARISLGNLLRCGILNELLVETEVYGINGNDSDIQSVAANSKFSVVNSSEKRNVTISYCDWWQMEYCGGIFDYGNNFLTNILLKYGNVNLSIVEPNKNPDILFYSVFGQNHRYVNAKKRVFFSGESTPINKIADYNLTFNKTTLKNSRFPLWIVYADNEVLKKNNERKDGNFRVKGREKFCSFICSNSRDSSHRKSFVEIMSKYKKVDCGGPFMNNIGFIVPRGENCSGKTEHNKKYKFSMAFENRDYPDYVTEKILDCYKSDCIPIYWGCKEVVNDFNPTTFINANDFANFEDLANYIIKVDNDDELYNSFFKERFLTQFWINVFLDPKSTFFVDIAKNILS